MRKLAGKLECLTHSKHGLLTPENRRRFHPNALAGSAAATCGPFQFTQPDVSLGLSLVRGVVLSRMVMPGWLVLSQDTRLDGRRVAVPICTKGVDNQSHSECS